MQWRINDHYIEQFNWQFDRVCIHSISVNSNLKFKLLFESVAFVMVIAVPMSQYTFYISYKSFFFFLVKII